MEWTGVLMEYWNGAAGNFDTVVVQLEMTNMKTYIHAIHAIQLKVLQISYPV